MDRRAQAGPWVLGIILARLAPKNDDCTASIALAVVLKTLR